MPNPSAGWYDDPTMVNTRRYWDGAKWTEHRQEVPAPSPVTKPVALEDPSKFIHVGYLFAVFFPPIGLVIGLSRLNKEPEWARKTIGLSVFVMVLGVVLYLLGHYVMGGSA